jgi:DNA polymerase III delta subunit
MIYFLYGDTTEESSRAVHKKASALATDLLKKKPSASLFALTDENWSEAAIDEYTGSQGLFEHKYIVVAKDIFAGGTGGKGEKGNKGGKERKEAFLEKIELFAVSPNIFIFAESSIDKASLKKIEKNAEKIQEIKGIKGSAGTGAGISAGISAGATAIKSKNDFKIFDLADALGERDKKNLWALYRRAIDSGKAPEEIHGIFFWQVKSMILASRSTSAGSAGLNPFVFGKAKRYAEHFEKDDLMHMLERLISIYHDAHRGMGDFEMALEIFILKEM